MQKVTQLKIGPLVLLVVLALLAYLAVHRNGLTDKQAEDEAVGEVVKLGDAVGRDDFRAVALLALLALGAFVAWTVLRAKRGEDKPMAPTKESRASGPPPP
jgi:hypothetical protein